MRAKAQRALKHLRKIKAAEWVIDALGDYFNLCEQQLSEAEMDVIAQVKMGEKRKKVMEMCGVHIHSSVSGRAINFLYDNIEELQKKNPNQTFAEMLFKLQILFDDIEGYGKIMGIEPPLQYTIVSLKEARRRLNEEFKKR